MLMPWTKPSPTMARGQRWLASWRPNSPRSTNARTPGGWNFRRVSSRTSTRSSPTTGPASWRSVNSGPRTRPRWGVWRTGGGEGRGGSSGLVRASPRPARGTDEGTVDVSEAEAKIGTRLIFGPNTPDHDAPVARPLTELLAEAEAQAGEEISDQEASEKANKAKETPRAVDEVTANRPPPVARRVRFPPLVACESVVIGACDLLSLLLRDGSSWRSVQLHHVDD
jgi:hypothetical protein